MQKRKPAVPGWGPRKAREREWADQADKKLKHAKQLFKDSEAQQQEGALIITELHKAGLSMKAIGKKIGRSTAWVHGTIKWCQGGFKDATPFGPGSKKARENKKRQASHHTHTQDEITESFDEEDDGNEAYETETDPVDELGDDDNGGQGFAKASRAAVKLIRQLDRHRRRSLIESLEDLGSSKERARLDAARNVVQFQKAIGVDWQLLLIPAYDDQKR